MKQETIDELHERQAKDLRIRNNPLSLYPDSLDTLLDANFPDMRWIVEGLLPAEGITIISAAPGSFKTWIMLEIALGVTQGKKVFGQFETEKVGVLIVDEESGARMLKERFLTLQSPYGLPIAYFSRVGHKVSQDYIDSILSVCAANDLGLVMFDSLVRLHQGDENASKDMAELFDLFKQLTDNGISVLIAHHNRKGIAGSYNPAADMRGSSDILAAVDCHLALNKLKNGEYIEVRQTKNRYMQELNPFKLRFVSNGSNCEFQFAGTSRSKQDEDDELKSAILKQLEKTAGVNKRQLLELLQNQGVKIKYGAMGDLLDELNSDNQIIIESGSRNALSYSLPPTDGSAAKSQ